ncbi:ABC transporter permease [Brachybacterium sp. NBEC-018]|uniref:ABC transporter permease n=1 Tax=Brachybacterium sp. NBEC-018 TaxID=2996004 RepID=UPI002174DECE|nr:ABC transporter permease [Brachybacterium sp. NBEC-018]UVY84525.1 ABC transporter permease [Brachybacterium sp. NBEC-018]
MSVETRTADPAAPPGASGRGGSLLKGRGIGELLMDQRAFVALIVLVIVFSLLSDAFLTPSNLVVMTKHVAYNAILALGMLLVIITGGIDLSVGSVVGLSGIVAGMLLQGWELSLLDTTAYPAVWVVVVIALAVGGLVGALNGLLVTRFHVAPFIATLGTMYIARGAALLISDGTTFPRLQGDEALGNTGFSFLGLGTPLGIPTAIWIMVVAAVLVWLLVARSGFGRHLFATGGNERAAELSGVKVRSVKMRVYVISGLCAAMAGLIIASELTSAAPQTGQSFELNAIAAVVIGGASLAGGRGSVRGALIGAFVIGFLSDGLVLIGVSSFWQTVIKGLVIVLAVILDQSQVRLKRRRAAAAAARSLAADTAEVRA